MSFHKLLFSRNQRDFYFSWHRVKYGLDHFLDHFWTPFWIIFWTNFLDHFKGEEHTISIEGGVGWSLWVLREGWETECYYPGRGERRTITTQGGVGGGCYRKHYWFNWFFDWIFVCLNFSAGPRRFFIFRHAKAKLPRKHWTLRFADGKYRQATVATIVPLEVTQLGYYSRWKFAYLSDQTKKSISRKLKYIF